MSERLGEYVVGDSLELMRDMPKGKFDAIVTDPPFGIGFKYNKHKDQTNPDDYWAWFKPYYDQMIRVLKPGGLFCCWQTQTHFKHFWKWYGDDIHIYVGAKNFVQLRKTPINYGYDPIIMKYKKGAAPLRPDKPKRSVDFYVADTAKWGTQTNDPVKQHPCPRPRDQVEEIVRNFVLPGGVVLDPFVGSGTTLLVCSHLGIECLGIDIDEDYKEVYRKRTSGWF